MPDLRDGESIEVKGSGSKPYVLKNVGGVYSCTCPAWRNQSVGIEQRTCKHLRALRGEEAEQARVGSALPHRPVSAAGEKPAGPPLLLAERWESHIDPTGWWMSEKLDGVRAYWNGKTFQSRLGNPFFVPDWFLTGLPDMPLDGEFWLARKKFQQTSGIVRRQDKTELWRQITYVVFDAPAAPADFEARLALLTEQVTSRKLAHVVPHPHEVCRGLDHLQEELARVEALGGEGLMLRQPRSKYEVGRSTTLLKVKSFLDAEARVIEHQAGAGRHKGRLGALLVELADGTRFSVGTGFSDAERESPPPVGSVISFRYQELSDGGVPRFPSYVGARGDVELPPPAVPTPPAKSGRRRFEFVEGKSSKFWEVEVRGSEMSVRYGKVGSEGQTRTKTFKDEPSAAMKAAKLIAEKTADGYVEK
jgi:DNA ligase-1